MTIKQPSIVIVSGPKGCGKTRNRSALMQIFSCDACLDSWQGEIGSVAYMMSYAARAKAHGPSTSAALGDYRLLVLTDIELTDLAHRQYTSLKGEGFAVSLVSFEALKDQLSVLNNAETRELDTRWFVRDEGDCVVVGSEKDSGFTFNVRYEHLLQLATALIQVANRRIELSEKGLARFTPDAGGEAS